MRRLFAWLGYRFEVYRFGVGPMYPLYRVAVERKRALDEALARGEDPGFVPLDALAATWGLEDVLEAERRR